MRTVVLAVLALSLAACSYHELPIIVERPDGNTERCTLKMHQMLFAGSTLIAGCVRIKGGELPPPPASSASPPLEAP
jgi:hypothetical protein